MTRKLASLPGTHSCCTRVDNFIAFAKFFAFYVIRVAATIVNKKRMMTDFMLISRSCISVRIFFPLTILLFYHSMSGVYCSYIVQDSLYAENFTYYKVNTGGQFILELVSLSGDADLYVSCSNLNPTFVDYDMKSESCGTDSVTVSSKLQRPIGVGVYAHPSHMTSSYRLQVISSGDSGFVSSDYEALFNKYHHYVHDSERGQKTDLYSDDEDNLSGQDDIDDESVWWDLFVSILKLILNKFDWCVSALTLSIDLCWLPHVRYAVSDVVVAVVMLSVAGSKSLCCWKWM